MSVSEAIVNADGLQPGVEYVRILGDGDPYRFIPLALAPIGVLGELVTAIGPGEWHGGPMVVIRPQGKDAAPPVRHIERAPGVFDDTNLGAAIDRALEKSTTPAAELRDLLRKAATVALDLKVSPDTFTTAASVAYAEMERRKKNG